MKITATNKATGEVIELEANSPKEVVEAWRIAQEYEKAATALKEQLKKLVPSFVGDKGISEPIGSYQFRVTSIQRKTYDFEVFDSLVKDEDFKRQCIKVDKSFVDKQLKEQNPILWPISTELRASMIPEGKPYQTIRLEKLDREEATVN